MERLLQVYAGHQARLERLLRARSRMERTIPRYWGRLPEGGEERLQGALSGCVQEIQACRNVLARMENDGRLRRALSAH